MESAVEVEDLSGGEGEIAAGDGGDGLADVLGSAPSLDGREALGDELVILVFDGGGHEISHLNIVGESHLGLFGRLSGEVRGLGVVDVNIFGLECIGALAGSNDEGCVANCYSAGAVDGSMAVGGLVGLNGGSVRNSFATGSISACKGVGGLVGCNDRSVANCYSTASVCGRVFAGGLVGDNNSDATVSDSYSAGTVSNNPDLPGNQTEPEGLGGLIGDNTGHVIDSFWDVKTSGQPGSDGGAGLSTAEMQTASTYRDGGWDFIDETENGTEDIWWILDGRDYPRLWWELLGDGIAEPIFEERQS